MFESKMNSLQADVDGYNQKYSYYQSYYDAAQRKLQEQSDRDVASVSTVTASPYDSFSILGNAQNSSQSSMYNMGTPQFAMPLMQSR